MSGYIVKIDCECGICNTVFLRGDKSDIRCGDCGRLLFSAYRNRGYVYILSNESMPRLLKIGYTERSVEERVVELNSTGVPVPFEVDAIFYSANPQEDESLIHNSLCNFRINKCREFFAIEPAHAIQLISELLNSIPFFVRLPEFRLSEDEYRANIQKMIDLRERYLRMYNDICSRDDKEMCWQLKERALEKQSPLTRNEKRKLVLMVENEFMLEKLINYKMISSSEKLELEAIFEKIP